MLKRLAGRAATLAVAITTFTVGATAQSIDTRGNNNSTIAGGAGIFGQSFTVPSGTSFSVLSNFSFFVSGTSSTDLYSYQAKVYAFNGSAPTGAPLYVSDVRVAPPGSSGTVPPAATFSNLGLSLTPGQVYFALIQRTSAGSLLLGVASNTGSGFSSTYAGGALFSATSYAADPTTVAYTTDFVAPGADLMFVANFASTVPTSTVPEPSTYVLTGVGLVGIAVVARRRRGVR